jgi:hypothetical protein
MEKVQRFFDIWNTLGTIILAFAGLSFGFGYHVLSLYLTGISISFYVVALYLKIKETSRNHAKFIFSILFIFCWVSVIAIHEFFIKPKIEYSGALMPDNKLRPKNACNDDMPENAMLILLGSNGVFFAGKNIDIIRMGNLSVLSATRTNKGLFVSLKLFDDSGIILTEIFNNNFLINKNNYCIISRPNEHILKIKNKHNKKALEIEFLNPTTVRLLGSFYCPPNFHVNILEKSLIYRNVEMTNYCFGESKVCIQF